MVIKALSESISKLIMIFKLLKIILLVMHSLLIKKAIGSFIYNFKYFLTVN